jgi:futalosine hydrolase
MHVLLAAATTLEVRSAMDALEQGPGRSGAHSIEWLITGVGTMATTWSLTRQIDRRRPDLIIQAGVAGCFTELAPGTVVAVSDDRLADEGVWEEGRFKSIFELRLADGDIFPFTDGRLINPYRGLLDRACAGAVGAITVNEITTDAGRIGWLQQNTAAVVESMEGAPFHFVCLQAGIPFLQLRSVSNAVGVRDKTKWNMGLAISALNERLLGLLDALAGKDGTIF